MNFSTSSGVHSTYSTRRPSACRRLGDGGARQQQSALRLVQILDDPWAVTVADRRQRRVGAADDEGVADADQVPFAEAETQMRLATMESLECRERLVGIVGEYAGIGLQDHGIFLDFRYLAQTDDARSDRASSILSDH